MRSESLSNPLPEHIYPTHSAFYRTRHLERNAELGISLHVFEGNLLTPPVIQFSGSAVGKIGYRLSGFKIAIIFSKITKR